MSNDSASSIIIKDSKLQSMTNFPLRSAFEFPVSSQSQRVMCAKKKEFVKNLLLLAPTYQHTRLLFCCLKIRLSSSRHSVMIASQRLAWWLVISLGIASMFPPHLRNISTPPLGTIPILRQQKDWVAGSRKWPLLLTFSNVFMLIR